MEANDGFQLMRATVRGLLAPACPCWPFVFSQQFSVRVGECGMVPVGPMHCTIEAPPRTRVVRCLRPDGDIFFPRSGPKSHTQPIALRHQPPVMAFVRFCPAPSLSVLARTQNSGVESYTTPRLQRVDFPGRFRLAVQNVPMR